MVETLVSESHRLDTSKALGSVSEGEERREVSKEGGKERKEIEWERGRKRW